VNIASVGGKIAVPHMLPYVASKFALVGFSEGLHAEMRHKGVRVTTVCPGLMRTGAESGVKFAGDAPKEYRWFKFGAEAPLVSISARAAARKIYAATVAGKAEITITPQAWLGARAVGLAPNFSQCFAAGVNRVMRWRYLLFPNHWKKPIPPLHTRDDKGNLDFREHLFARIFWIQLCKLTQNFL
jgi:short-subunit dehydrogenase